LESAKIETTDENINLQSVSEYKYILLIDMTAFYLFIIIIPFYSYHYYYNRPADLKTVLVPRRGRGWGGGNARTVLLV